jgi:hypothetical protein
VEEVILMANVDFLGAIEESGEPFAEIAEFVGNGGKEQSLAHWACLVSVVGSAASRHSANRHYNRGVATRDAAGEIHSRGISRLLGEQMSPARERGFLVDGHLEQMMAQ